MRKIYIAMLAVAATLMMASCVQDVTDEGKDEAKVGLEDKNAIAFTLASQIETRSPEACAPVQGAVLSLGEPVLGQNVTLEETVTTLDPVCQEVPETRGTPVYTSNFFTMSGGSFRGLAFQKDNLSTPFITDGSFVWDDYFQKWVRYFEEDPWGDQTQLLYYARLAKDNPSGTGGQAIGVVYNSYQYLYDETAGPSMTFSYRSPFKAEDQQDILFACRPIDKAQTHSGIPILFYHALTGVKFATAHDNDGATKTFIDKVEFTGLYGYGKCTVKSVMEGGEYVDIAGTHSSESAISWANVGFNGVNSATASYNQDFAEASVDYTSGSFASKGDYPASFKAAGSDAAHPANVNNLNDADASQTFWLVPQAMSDNVKLKVTFRIQSGNLVSEPITREIEFGKALAGVVWKPGELRTYTLKANEVDVLIVDEINSGTKENVVITNVGNVSEYVRAQIVGNWFGKGAGGVEGVALGYISADESINTYVAPWELVQEGTAYRDDFGGSFTGLPGANWVRGDDGFFYFTEIVDVNQNTSTPLFSTFTPGASVPTVYYIDNLGVRQPFTDVHLVIDIAVQAVEAPLKAGSTTEYEDYVTAWSLAGVTAPAVTTP